MRLAKEVAWWAKTGTTLGLAVWLGFDPPTFGVAYGVALGIVVLGAGLNLGHYGLLRSVGNAEAPHRLQTTGGLWPWVRHPMYLGEALVMIGLAIMLGGAAFGLLLVGVVGLWRLSLAEDAAMAARFGAEHAAWRQRSGLLLPRWSRGAREG